MSVKTAKTSLQVVRSIGDWARTQEPKVSGQLDSFVERWKVFEKEMNALRTNKSGPLRWEAPVRSTDESVVSVPCAPQVQSAAQIQSASNVQSPDQAQVQPRVVNPMTRTVNPPVRENKPNNANDIVPDSEEGRAELASYLKAHHREVEHHRENLKKQLDRIACGNLPKLERHIMVNPQKLYTPITKLKFEKASPNDASKIEGVKDREVPGEVFTKDSIPQAPGVEAGTQAFIKSTGFHPPALEDMSKRVMTKLAAWSKSIQPPVQQESVKPLQPQTVLQVLTSKPSQSSSIRQEHQTETSTTVESTNSVQSPLPPLIEHLQSSSGNSKAPDQLSPYPVVPFSVKYSLPTPSSDAMILPKSRRKIQKPPMSFESSLTSIERRMDMSMTQISPSVSLQ